MSSFYYANNEILLPAWRSPESRRSPWGWIVALLLVLFLVGGGVFYYLDSLSDQKAKEAVVLITNVGGEEWNRQGSGVIIHPTKGYILTNKHLLWHEGQQATGRIEVHFLSGDGRREILPATVQAQGQGEPGLSDEQLKYDWVVLKVNRPSPLPYLPLDKATEFQEEENIKVYGFPMADKTSTNEFGPSVKVLHGILSRVDRNDQGGVTRLTHDAKSAPGMSGGPITRKGKVIGMNTLCLYEQDQIDPNENYALPTFLLLEQIKNYLPEG
ncbi:MAG: trypsin-like peptidase domain-containing protein [Burkholderiales bacterium]|nr:trypsin-like peptidase domain-containing protein [Burkholderiales bacterium]